MHWLAVLFLVIKAVDNIAGNLNSLIDGEYNSLFGTLLGTAVNFYAWWYILNYILNTI